ncbi:MAG: hypothetical protein ACI8W8_001815 [Rhodothermales bacterium]
MRKAIVIALIFLAPALLAKDGIHVKLDTSEVPHLAQWGEEARAILIAWYPRINNLLLSEDTPAQETIRLKIRKADKGVGSTSGRTITIASSWIEKHPEDFGLVVHELVHVIQAYPKGKPWWVTEGIADYLRWGIYEGKELASFSRPKETEGYKKGYQVAAGFLLWLEADTAPGIVRRLNTSMRKGQYNARLFVEMRGKSLDELWAAYVGLD